MAPTNPARLYEGDAIATVREHIGARGTVIDLSATGDPDFRIDYDDATVGWGEIGWDADEDHLRLSAAIRRQVPGGQLRLASGTGTWTAALGLTARVDELRRALPEIVAGLHALGRRQWMADWVPDTSFDSELRNLGVRSLYHHRDDSTGDILLMTPDVRAEWISDDRNLISNWVSALVADRFASNAEKILRRDANERHLFFVAGDASPMSVDRALRALDQQIPAGAPIVPIGISHVWAMSQVSHVERAALWSATGGWQSVSLCRAQ